jgi:hypothetical protein
LQQNLAEMIGKIEKNPQLEMFKVPLKHFIKENYEFVLLSKKINWEQLESELGIYYCEDNGRLCIPIRTIAGVVLLKRIFDESDKSILDRWVDSVLKSRYELFAGYLSVDKIKIGVTVNVLNSYLISLSQTVPCLD